MAAHPARRQGSSRLHAEVDGRQARDRLLEIQRQNSAGHRSIVYNNMNNKLQNVAYYSDLESIQSNLNFLPFDYRDSQQIRTELQLILNDINVIRKSDIKDDYKRMRVSYYNLETLSNKLYRWNIIDLLDNQSELVKLLGAYGVSSYFNLEPCGYTEGFCLSTNLPTDQVSTKEYYYYHVEYEIFGYKNINNEDDKFDAFRILGVYQNYIKIYNLKNKQTYILDRDD